MTNVTPSTPEVKPPLRLTAEVRPCITAGEDLRNLWIALDGISAAVELCLQPKVAEEIARRINLFPELVTALAAYQEADRLEAIVQRCELPADQERFEAVHRRAQVLAGMVMEKLEGGAA